jgi:hypothetical protein
MPSIFSSGVPLEGADSVSFALLTKLRPLHEDVGIFQKMRKTNLSGVRKTIMDADKLQKKIRKVPVVTPIGCRTFVSS